MRGEEIGRAEGGETGGMQIGASENKKGRPEGGAALESGVRDYSTRSAASRGVTLNSL